MDGSAILYAGLGAGLGALIGSLITNRIPDKNFKSLITVLPMIIGWQGTVYLYKNMKLPRIFPMDYKSFEAETPGFTTLRQNDPSEFKALMNILDEPTRKGKLEQKHLDEFRKKLSLLVEKKRAIAPPELLRQQNALAAEQFRILRVKSPEICTAQANGRPYPVLTDILGEKYQVKEQKLMAKFFNVQPNEIIGDPKKGKGSYSDIVTANITALGLKTIDPKGDDTDVVTSQHQLVCKLFEETMLALNLLDDEGVRNVGVFLSESSLRN